MNRQLRRFALVAVVALVLSPTAFCANPDDDDKAPAGPEGTLPALNPEQQRAAGVVVAHPANTNAPQRDDAVAVVLDPVGLITDAGEVDASAATLRAAAAELERVRGLYDAGAGASLKALQSAQAEQARSRAQADAASAKFAARWRPVAAMPGAARQKLIDGLAAGTSLLVRADLPGRHILASVPDRALLDVDGVGVQARVLGVTAPSGEDAQSAAVLTEVRTPPPGLGPGARVPVALLGTSRAGVLVPRDAVLYDESGALVYKQLAKKPGDQQTRYAPVRVKLIQAQGDGWIVDGVDDDDDVVVHGAGVLWSLQGIVGHAAGDNDDD
jgi:hypothetical protein